MFSSSYLMYFISHGNVFALKKQNQQNYDINPGPAEPGYALPLQTV